MATNARSDVDELKREFADLRSDVSELTKTVRNMSREGVEYGRDQIRRTGERSRAQAREAVNSVEHGVGERPLTSIATAFGAGFVIGKLLDRKNGS